MTGDQTTGTRDKAAIRTELEQIRSDYHSLLDSLSEGDWKAKSANPSWNVGQLMWHLGFGMEFFSQSVGYCRKGKGPNPPSFMIDIGNLFLTRFGSRGASPTSCGKKFDAAHQALLEALDGVQDGEWERSARIYGDVYTIESSFQGPGEHFGEHRADILKGLGRA
jgi:hypothetical protein